MKKLDLLAVAFLSVPLAACWGGDPNPARAEIFNALGDRVGTALFTPDPKGVRVQVEVSNLSPGLHGIHIHGTARCDPPDFISAGDHFDPNGNHHHGMDHNGPHHAGDLPNLHVEPDGTGKLEAVLPDVTLTRGHHSLFYRGGTSIIIHAEPDDLKSASSAGERIACGVITR